MNDFKAGFEKKLAAKIFKEMDESKRCSVTPTLVGVVVSGRINGVRAANIVESMTGAQSAIFGVFCNNEEYQLAEDYIAELEAAGDYEKYQESIDNQLNFIAKGDS